MMAAAVLVALPLHVYVTIRALEWVFRIDEKNRIRDSEYPGGRLLERSSRKWYW
jgi:hypothetical protein